MMYRLHKPAVVLAALLQVLPLARTLMTNPATASTFAIILRWGIGAGAVIGSVDAVSGATSTFTTPSTFSGAVGTIFSNNVSVSIGGGNTAASSDYFITSSGTVTSTTLGNGQSTTNAMPPGLNFKSSWVNNASTIGGVIYGTPTTAGSFPVTVTCVSPGNAQLSQAITITISGVTTPTAPSITGQPVALNVAAGKNASFTVTAGGTAPLIYYWSKNNVRLADGGNVAGSSTATLTLTGVSATDAGSYSVLVSNAVGTATSTAAALTVVLPPAIATQPAPQTQAVGASATFSVTATGSTPLNYFWIKNGAAIANGTKYSGVNTSNLIVATLATTDAGNYSVTITNLAGSVTSSVAALTIVSSPTITTPPANVSVIAGSNASFTVTAAGSAPLVYQWLKGGTPLADGGNVSGSTTATLNLSAVSAGDAASYSVTVSNSLGGVISPAATLTVAIPPAVTASPVGATILAGSNVTFTVTASGTAPLAYQWLKNNVKISGATSATLSLANVTIADAANYSVTVTNAVGSATSAAATLTVLAPPAITLQPANTTVAQGSNVSLTVTASGTAPLTYQWLKNSAPISGATSNVLTLTAVTTNDAAGYSVLITNIVGNVTSSSATLTVLVPPTIVTQPASVTSVAGSNVSFTVTAGGSGTLTYQWLKNGVNISGATSATLTLVNVSLTNAANYSVVVGNAASSVTSGTATLTVLSPPAITSQPANATVAQSSNVTFTVTASGTAPLVYQWLKNGSPISGATSNVLTLTAVTTNDAASYSVVVTNIVGNIASSSAPLTVLVPPTIVSSPASATVTQGNSASFTVTASGTAPLTYQWLKNGVNISGATSAALTFTSASTTNAANYSVTVANAAGSATSAAATLTVQTPPSIVTQPASQFGALGSPITLSVSASGTGPLNYQWFQSGVALADGGNISGSTSNVLTIAALTTNEIATYFVVVSNVIGSVTSTNANISVNVAPIITVPPTDQYVAVGSNAVLTVATTGSNPLTYQWLKNGVKLANSATVSGATSSSLTLLKTTATSSANYSVIVKNVYGSVTSVAAKLSVLTPPSIAAAPRITIPQTGGSARAGTNAVFTIKPTGSAPLSYQWFKNGVALVNGGNVSGATTNTLKISALTTNDTAVYHVVVSNPVGRATSPQTALTVFVAPIITQSPASQSVRMGQRVTFRSSATGTAPLRYQWYKNTKAIPGATNLVFTIATAKATDAGTYYAVVSNFAGSSTSAKATLTVTSGDGGGNDNLRTQATLATVSLPPFITNLSRNSVGGVTLNASGTAGTNYILQASADLQSWTNISTNTADTNGQWQATDPDAATLPARFYRLATP